MCPNCNKEFLVNSIPLTKFVACHGCKTFYELKIITPENPFKDIGQKISIDSIKTMSFEEYEEQLINKMGAEEYEDKILNKKFGDIDKPAPKSHIRLVKK